MLTELEKLAVAQAFFKVASEIVSTSDPDSLRSTIDAEMLDNYEKLGIKSIDVRANGENVGTYSVVVSEQKELRTIGIENEDTFNAWMSDNPELLVAFARENGDVFARYAVNVHGELPDGVTVGTQAIPERATGTRLKVEPDKVIKAFGNGLPEAVRGLLGDADGR